MLDIKVIDGEKVIWVKPLNEELEPIPAELVINADEKPMFADSASSRTIGIARAQNRGKSWTITPCINARGDLIFTSLILRGKSLDPDVVHDLGHCGIDVGAYLYGCVFKKG